MPVTTPCDGAGLFRVRIAFPALPGDVPGRRVFDVRLNGKTVLKDFDIVKEIGHADRAVLKEFVVPIEMDLTIDMATGSRNPSIDQMPLLNGLQVLRMKASTQ